MQHEPYEMNILHTGLVFEKSELVLVVITASRLLNLDVVQNFYESVVYELNLTLFILLIGFNIKYSIAIFWVAFAIFLRKKSIIKHAFNN